MIFRNSEQQFHERIRDEILSRLTQTSVAEVVEFFLLQHWSRLLRDIYLARGDDHPDWQAGWDTVDALLWSLNSTKAPQDRERLLRLLPILQGRLKEGCVALGLPDTEQDALFSYLARQHAALAGVQSLAAGQGRIPGDISAGPGLGMATSFGIKPPPSARAPSTLEGLQPGDWVTFRCAEGDKRLRLQWISATRAMFLFADSQGLDALSLTRQRLQERWSRGEVALEG